MPSDKLITMHFREKDAWIAAWFPAAGGPVKQRNLCQQIIPQVSRGVAALPQVFGELRSLFILATMRALHRFT